MSDPLTLASTAIQILSKTTEALNALRERAQRSKDVDVKEQINTLYDNVLQLKEVVSRLLDENRDLKRKLEEQAHPPEQPTLRQIGDTNYYYRSDGDGPYCQTCYDKNEKMVKLPPTEEWNGGLRRDCPVCDGTFWDRRMQR